MAAPVTRWSSSWPGTAPRVTVVVSTFSRAGLLGELLRALERQTLPRDDFEVVVADNGSTDGTWDVLVDAVVASPLRLLAARLPANRGAAGGRNAALGHGRAAIVAFTDDDCLPQPRWLAALVATVDAGADVVQGRTEPDPTPGPWPQPWARTVWILEPSWLFETCNVAYRRSALDAAGGFTEHDPMTQRHSGRAFGEDVLLGWRVVDAGARFAFCDEAVVHHRWMPGSYRGWLAEMRQLRHFPALTKRAPGIARSFWRDPFLSRRTAATGLALAGVAAAAIGRGPVRLLGALAAGPWFVEAVPRARVRRGRPLPVRLGQVALADAVASVSLLEGSVRSGRLLL